MQVRTTGVAHEQSVSRHHKPGGVAPRAVRDDVRVMRSGMPWGSHRLDLRVAELDHLTVSQRMVLELDTRALGQVRGRTGASDELRQTGDMVRLNVRVE